MPRYSTEKGEIAAKKGADKRFETEAGKLPKKPRGGIDGLYTGRSRPKEMVAEDQHLPQVLGEGKGKSLRAANYENDTKGWSRGGDAGGSGRPGFDNGRLDIGNKPPSQEAARKRAEAAEAINGGYKQPSGKFTGTGQDMKASPFSKAHRKGAGEGF